MSQLSPVPGSCWLSIPLVWITAAVLHAPRRVLTCAVLLAVLASALAMWSLKFKTNRLDLLNRDSEFNQRWLAHLDEFGDQDDVVIVVEGADSTEIAAAMQDIATRVAAENELFESVIDRRDLSAMQAKALHFLSPEQLQSIDAFLAEWSQVLEGDWSQLSVKRMLERVPQGIASQPTLAALPPDGSDTLSASADSVMQAGFASPQMPPSPFAATDKSPLAATIVALAAALAGDPQAASIWPESLYELRRLGERFQPEPLIDARHAMGFVLLRFKAREASFVSHDRALGRLRELIGVVQAARPAVRLGVTGMPVLENDEMQASQVDSIGTGMLSLAGVAAVFVAGFGGVRRPMMTVLALLIALAWSFGFVTLTLGHLNILSVSFGVILIGLGIDFGIHYVTHYAQRVDEGRAPADALLDAARHVGPGIVTGGLTTALAFCTTVLTRFTGVAELGVIAAGGIVLCVVAAITVLPAMIVLADRPTRQLAAHKPLPIDWLCYPLQCRPKRTLVLLLGLTALTAAGIGRLTYDHNLLNLQPVGLESAALSRRLATDQDRGVWFAVCSRDSRDELLALEKRLEALEVVSATDEIASALPVGDSETAALIARIHQRLERLPEQVPLIPVAARDELLPQLERMLGQSSAASSATGPDRNIVATLQQLPSREYFRRLSEFQQRMAGELLDILRSLQQASDPDPPQLSDLPAGLTDRFTGKSGRFLLRVHGHGDTWNMDALARFVQDVESVAPQITGHPVQTYYASRQMQQSYLHAAVYSLLAVSIVLMVDFRRIRYWMLAMVPMGLGMLQMFGLLGWLGIPLNPANMIVLPLILGIGIDDGVHVIHDFARQTGGSYRMSSSTASAVLFTSATTMIGFGSMMFASHQGLRSLGQVLTIGVLCCLVSTLFALPCVLSLLGGVIPLPAGRPLEPDR